MIKFIVIAQNNLKMWCKHVNTSTKQVLLFKKYEFQTGTDSHQVQSVEVVMYVISIGVIHPLVCDLEVYCRNK